MPRLVTFLACFFLLFSSSGFSQIIGLPEGEILSKNGSIIEIRINGGCNSLLNSEYALDKHFVQEIFGAQATGWLTVAKVEVVNCEERSLKVKIVEIQSEITVNGEKVNHFKVGNLVKLTELNQKE